jgi:hypothetical protein
MSGFNHENVVWLKTPALLHEQLRGDLATMKVLLVSSTMVVSTSLVVNPS